VENNSTWLPSPPSPANSVRSGFNLSASIVFAAGAVIIALAAIVAFVLLASSTGAVDLNHRVFPIMFELVGELAIYVPVAAFMLIFLPLLAKRSLAELGLRPPGFIEIAIAILGAFAMLIAVDGAGAIVTAITHRHDTEAAIALLKNLKTAPEKFLFLSIAVLFAPMLEELGFRVFLFNAFARYTPVWLAALASGLIFGAVHSTSPSQLLTVSVPLACGGVVLAGVYAASRNYWSSVITHALFNAVPLTLIFVFHVKA
jgi:membrane protease YdiL (CAAX protease family)